MMHLVSRRAGGEPSATPPGADGLTVLDRRQAIALVRNVSFGRRNRPVHDLLEALSAAGTEGIAGESLRTRLRLKDARQVRRLIDWATQLVQLVTHDERARLAQHSSDADVYSLHPITRENLHAIFARLGRSARGEAPLWE
jgi:hypothetical protein